MARRPRARNKGETPALEMTPMIDVVFQLLIFFIVCVKQEDILARLIADRPAPNNTPPPDDFKPPEFIDIEISRDAIIFMRRAVAADLRPLLSGRDVNYSKLDQMLEQQARFDATATVTIRATLDSNHGALMQVLNLCRKHKLSPPNIFSM